MAYVMEEAAKRKLAGRRARSARIRSAAFDIEGPSLGRRPRSASTAICRMPIRHGMTLGELARLFNGEKQIGADLTVVPMKNWRRDDWFDETGLPWINPSPNMRNMVAATLYPGIGAIEGTNISVGRGTDTPFEQIGAPVDRRRGAGGGAQRARTRRASASTRSTFTPAAGAKLGRAGVPRRAS